MTRNCKNKRKKIKSATSVIFIFVFLLFFLIQPVNSLNSIERDIVVLFDASGSMDDFVSGEGRKIDIAKDAVKDFLQKLDPNDRVALIVFYDCDDIQVEAGLTYSHSSISNSVEGIEPDGGTPIGDALSFAWNYLRNDGDMNHDWYIVVFTDGGESCGSDPCDIALRISSESLTYRKTVVYTVGFLIGPDLDDEEELRCIAEATGGEYFPASSSEELGEAFEEIAEIMNTDSINEIILYTVVSTALLSILLATHTLISRHSKKGGERPRERRRSTYRSPREEAVMWGAADEDQQDDEDLAGGEFVDW